MIYAAHTNLDNAFGGVNYKIAEILGLDNIRTLQPKENLLLKLVTYVPTEYANGVRTALFHAGCGNIGNYDSCSFSQTGEGSYRALKGANPFLGNLDELHIEKEIKIETILPAYKKNEVVKALMASHPYEEPAYDFYTLLNDCQQIGSGIIGDLINPIEETEFLKMVKERFKVESLKHNSLSGKTIRSVAVCGGAGSFLLPQAIRSGADVFITGEIRYPDYFGHDNEILMTEIGHYESEHFINELLYSIISESFLTLQPRSGISNVLQLVAQKKYKLAQML